MGVAALHMIILVRIICIYYMRYNYINQVKCIMGLLILRNGVRLFC